MMTARASLKTATTSSCGQRLAFTTLVQISGFEGLHQPGDDDLLKDQRVWPNLYLASQVPTLWIDPCSFGRVAVAEQQINIGDWDLGVLDPGQDQHRCHRLVQRILFDERHFRQLCR